MLKKENCIESKYVRNFERIVLAISIVSVVGGIVASWKKWCEMGNILEMFLYFAGHLCIAVIILVVGMTLCEFFDNIYILAHK